MVALGIDFGTSNSTAGYVQAGKARLVALEGERKAIPSAIFYDTEENTTLFGAAAIAAYVDYSEGRLLRALKSILGSALMNDTTQIGSQRRAFKLILAEFLGHLKRRAEAELNQSVESVVLGRPVSFVDGDATADALAQSQLEQAARACGFKHIDFQYEPIAAALDYEQSVTREEIALIVDIGGGTSDFSIVRVSQESRGKTDRKNDVLANTGVHIGGTDVDRRLSVDQVMPYLGYRTRLRDKPSVDLPAAPFYELATWHKIALLYNNKTIMRLRELRDMAAQPKLVDRLLSVVERRNGHRLAGRVEEAKITLSQSGSALIDIGFIEPDLKKAVRQEAFEAAIAPDILRIQQEIAHCLTLAQLKPEQITTLFLTGGTTAIPCVYHGCTQSVPHARVVEGDKFGSVGAGLALDAANKFGARA